MVPSNAPSNAKPKHHASTGSTFPLLQGMSTLRCLGALLGYVRLPPHDLQPPRNHLWTCLSKSYPLDKGLVASTRCLKFPPLFAHVPRCIAAALVDPSTLHAPAV